MTSPCQSCPPPGQSGNGQLIITLFYPVTMTSPFQSCPPPGQSRNGQMLLTLFYPLAVTSPCRSCPSRDSLEMDKWFNPILPGDNVLTLPKLPSPRTVCRRRRDRGNSQTPATSPPPSTCRTNISNLQHAYSFYQHIIIVRSRLFEILFSWKNLNCFSHLFMYIWVRRGIAILLSTVNVVFFRFEPRPRL
jgi:hypothetical protein